jgi:hypothetical protein
LNNSLTAQNIAGLLPFESVVSKWGEELFLAIKELRNIPDNRTRHVDVGDVAFSPAGNCLCVFLGATPASVVLGKPVSENPVVVVGKLLSIPEELKSINAGEKVKVIVSGKAAPRENGSAAERKLSQSEIDILVKQLLEGKRDPR